MTEKRISRAQLERATARLRHDVEKRAELREMLRERMDMLEREKTPRPLPPPLASTPPNPGGLGWPDGTD